MTQDTVDACRDAAACHEVAGEDRPNGFPVGTHDDGPVARMSWHSVATSAAAEVAFTALSLRRAD